MGKLVTRFQTRRHRHTAARVRPVEDAGSSALIGLKSFAVDSILFDRIHLLHWRSDVSELFLIGGSATIYLSGLSGIEFPFWNSALAAGPMYTLDRAMPQLGAELHQTTFSVQESHFFSQFQILQRGTG